MSENANHIKICGFIGTLRTAVSKLQNEDYEAAFAAYDKEFSALLDDAKQEQEATLLLKEVDQESLKLVVQF